MKIFLFLLVTPVLSWAQAKAPSEFIQLAMDRVPQLKAEAASVNASLNELKQSKLLANPVFTFQGGALRGGEVMGGVADLTLNQPLPWPGRRSGRIKISQTLVNLSELNFEETKVVLANRIYLLCAEISALKLLEDHHSERKHRFNLIHTFIRSRPNVSPRQIVEKDLMETQIRMVEKNMLELTARRQGLIKELEILSGVEKPEVKFSWNDLPQRPEISSYQSKIDKSITFQKMRLNEKISAQQIENARLEARPDIFVGVNYRRENVYPSNDFYHAQVSLVVPIIDHGQHSEEVARARAMRVEAENKATSNQVERDISLAFTQIDAAYRSAELFPLKKIAEFDGNFKRAETAFRKGQIDAMLFLQIDSQVYETFQQVYSSRLNYYTQLAELNRIASKFPEL